MIFIALTFTLMTLASSLIDIEGSYQGRFTSIGDSPQKGRLYFSLNTANIYAYKANIVQSELAFINEDETRFNFVAYGWVENDQVILFSNKETAISRAPKEFQFHEETFSSSLEELPGLSIDCDANITMDVSQYQEDSSSLSSSPSSSRHYQNNKRFDISITSGKIRGPQCDIFTINMDFTANLFKEDVYISKAQRYACIMIIANIIQMFYFSKQLRFSSTTARAQKLSIWTYAILGFYDSFMTILHSFFGTSFERLFNTFMILAVSQFIMFAVFEMKIMFLITQARNPEQFQGNWDDVRRQLANWYLKSHLLLILGVVAVYFQHMEYFAPIFLGFWIPQIIHNVYYGVNRGALPRFIIVTSIVKMLFVGYLYGCPEQIIFSGMKPTNWPFLASLYCFLWIQVLILFAMDTWGSRFFIPKRWQPARYEYHRPLEQDLEDAPECAICFSLLDGSDDSDLQNIEIMITPCDHAFHDHCLIRWMEQQMKCPTCRGNLPPP